MIMNYDGIKEFSVNLPLPTMDGYGTYNNYFIFYFRVKELQILRNNSVIYLQKGIPSP